MLPAMKTRDAIAKAKGRDKLARILGITGSAVSQWGEDVPELREFQLRRKKPGWFRVRRTTASEQAAA